jgi:hypothetical protein
MSWLGTCRSANSGLTPQEALRTMAQMDPAEFERAISRYYL